MFKQTEVAHVYYNRQLHKPTYLIPGDGLCGLLLISITARINTRQVNGKMLENLAYCECWTGNKIAKAECRCGEDDSQDMEWTWQPSEYPTVKVTDSNDVLFHPVYSQGTAMVRGTTPLQPGYHHFWEIKMTSTVCGTDLMVGVGTGDIDLQENKYKFVSALGIDQKSWGFSYRGIAQHDNESRYYGQKFGVGSIVGVHLDLFRGTLEFYLNRLPLGIAFRNIPVNGGSIYPMVSSTAAKSEIKLINSNSFRNSLQYHCMRTISRIPSLLSVLQSYPEGYRYNNRLWYLQRTEKFSYKNSNRREPDSIYEQSPIGHSTSTTPLGSAGDSPPVRNDDEDIYGDIDEEIGRIRQCHAENNPYVNGSDSEDGERQTVLFSYFCDHFA